MRILITGIGGFVGGHLAQHLRAAAPGSIIHGTVLFRGQAAPDTSVIYHELDLKDARAVSQLIADVRPDHVYHLAAQASPRRSFAEPWETLENNIRAQLNLIQACLALSPLPRLLIVSSAEIYGPVQPEQLPIDETTPFRPISPYGVSKVAQDMLGLQYYLSHGLPVIRARPFNHFGPGQSEGFVAPDFAIQIARIEAGQQEPIIRVGNLSAQRDFTDVRDVVRAYRLLMEHGAAGEAYNIASGCSYSIQQLLDILLKHSSAVIEVQPDPDRLLPIDVPIIRGDARRLRAVTGWEPTIRFEDTLLDILNDCRARVGGRAVH